MCIDVRRRGSATAHSKQNREFPAAKTCGERLPMQMPREKWEERFIYFPPENFSRRIWKEVALDLKLDG